MDTIELTTTLGRLKDLDEEAIGPYDAVYVGDPFCDCGVENLLERASDLTEAVRRLKALHKRVYLSTYVEPWTDAFDALRAAVALGIREGIDGVEVFDLGVLRLVAREFPELNVHLGLFVRLFNPQSVRLLAPFRIARIVPNPELSLEEIDGLRTGTSAAIELPVHGKIPLGYTERCALKPEKTGTKTPCRGDCYDPHSFLHPTGLAMRPSGRVTFGAKDLCMLPYLGTLLQRDYRHFRIEAHFESAAYRQRVGQLYRSYLEHLQQSHAQLQTISPQGLCNGFYFSRPGLEYV